MVGTTGRTSRIRHIRTRFVQKSQNACPTVVVVAQPLLPTLRPVSSIMVPTVIDVERSRLSQRVVVTQASSNYEKEKASSNDGHSSDDEPGNVWQPEDAWVSSCLLHLAGLASV